MERPLPQTRIRLAVNTQTPLVRLRQDALMSAPRLHLEDLVPEVDYKFTAGGVTRMLQPLLRRGLADGGLGAAEWVALAADERHPEIQTPDGFLLSYVGIPPDERPGYTGVKEHIWALLNSMEPTATTGGEPGAPEWRAFDEHQRRSARQLRHASGRLGGAHLYYVHDFQQMGVGGELAREEAPKVFHLHTPFPSNLPRAWADRIIDSLSRYDAVVCSTDRYAANLRSAGLRAPLVVIPPFIDPEGYPPASPDDVAAFRARYGIEERDRVVLNIARMDPMKGQDRLVRAMPTLLHEVPEARLVLIGNGSFSSSAKGGLGLSKGAQWRAHLEMLAEELDVAERVTFTGHVDDALVPAALTLCDAFVLPSTREGFGLAAIEAWRYRRPVIVSDRAGVAELIEDGANGRTLDCGDAERLARALADILCDPAGAAAMGDAGHAASARATLPEGERALRALFADLLEEVPLARP